MTNVVNNKRGNTEKPPVIKRQCSEQSMIATKFAVELKLGRYSPMQTPSLGQRVPSGSPELHDCVQHQSFFPSDDQQIKMKFNGIDVNDTDRDEKRSQQIDLSRDSFPSQTKEESSTPLQQQERSETDGFFNKFEETFNDSVHTLARGVNNICHEITDGMKTFVHKFQVALLPHEHQLKSECDAGNDVHLPSQMENGEVCRLGVRMIRSEKGYKLLKVVENTLAHKCGLRETDVVTHLDGDKLDSKDLVDVWNLFMRVKKTFTLTILREHEFEGHTNLTEMKVQITIQLDEVSATLEAEVQVYSSRVIYHTSSAPKYITQDGDHKAQTFLNVDTSDWTVKMGTNTDFQGIFKFDYYVPFFSNEGQLCTIRHPATNRVYNLNSGIMEMVAKQDIDESHLLYIVPRSDESVFRSFRNRDRFMTTSDEGIRFSRYGNVSAVPVAGSFRLVLTQD